MRITRYKISNLDKTVRNLLTPNCFNCDYSRCSEENCVFRNGRVDRIFLVTFTKAEILYFLNNPECNWEYPSKTRSNWVVNHLDGNDFNDHKPNTEMITKQKLHRINKRKEEQAFLVMYARLGDYEYAVDNALNFIYADRYRDYLIATIEYPTLTEWNSVGSILEALNELRWVNYRKEYQSLGKSKDTMLMEMQGEYNRICIIRTIMNEYHGDTGTFSLSDFAMDYSISTKVARNRYRENKPYLFTSVVEGKLVFKNKDKHIIANCILN